METLILSCSGGARKESLLNNLFEMLDVDGQALFADNLKNINLNSGNDGHFGFIEYRNGVLKIDGLTEAQAKEKLHNHEHNHTHAGHHHMYSDRRHEHAAHRHGHADHNGHAAHYEHADNKRAINDELDDSCAKNHKDDHRHEHHSVEEVHARIDALNVSDNVKANAFGVYGVLAKAEAKAHGTDVESVHFHEVGNAYAIASIVLICMIVELLAPQHIVSTPIMTGFGYVDCAHGRLAIPAPATANILEGLTVVKGDVEGELTTPTGAAIVSYFTDEYTDE